MVLGRVLGSDGSLGLGSRGTFVRAPSAICNGAS